LYNYQQNLSFFNNSLLPLDVTSTNMSKVMQSITNALTYTDLIPNNITGGGNMVNIAYRTPFDSNISTGTIYSLFP
jgi:hypothetical protein